MINAHEFPPFAFYIVFNLIRTHQNKAPWCAERARDQHRGRVCYKTWKSYNWFMEFGPIGHCKIDPEHILLRMKCFRLHVFSVALGLNLEIPFAVRLEPLGWVLLSQVLRTCGTMTSIEKYDTRNLIEN